MDYRKKNSGNPERMALIPPSLRGGYKDRYLEISDSESDEECFM